MRGDIQAVVFDLDGVLVDSETLWDDARRDLVATYAGTWRPTATSDMMGMSSSEWSAYIHEDLAVRLSVERISSEVAGFVDEQYAERLPLLPAHARRCYGSRIGGRSGSRPPPIGDH